jgi:predicted Zn-ribbon and HTH transcriptional regulator
MVCFLLHFLIFLLLVILLIEIITIQSSKRYNEFSLSYIVRNGRDSLVDHCITKIIYNRNGYSDGSGLRPIACQECGFEFCRDMDV